MNGASMRMTIQPARICQMPATMHRGSVVNGKKSHEAENDGPNSCADPGHLSRILEPPGRFAAASTTGGSGVFPAARHHALEHVRHGRGSATVRLTRQSELRDLRQYPVTRSLAGALCTEVL